jgi:actin related protein 2/3 complex subunit 3
MRSLADPETIDIIDESLTLFRANCLFRNYEINGPADRLLIYLTLFISECLLKINATKGGQVGLAEAKKVLNTLSLDSFALPGDASFPLNTMYAPPANAMDAGKSFLGPHLSTPGGRCSSLGPRLQII